MNACRTQSFSLYKKNTGSFNVHSLLPEGFTLDEVRRKKQTVLHKYLRDIPAAEEGAIVVKQTKHFRNIFSSCKTFALKITFYINNLEAMAIANSKTNDNII